MTQNEMILEHLRNRGSITSMEAIQRYGITRLSARIYDLRAGGHIITNETKITTNRYGKKVKYDIYRMNNNG